MDSTVREIIGVLIKEGPIADILYEMANECVLNANKFKPGAKQERWLIAAHAIRKAEISIRAEVESKMSKRLSWMQIMGQE